jgi:hypothetical protein
VNTGVVRDKESLSTVIHTTCETSFGGLSQGFESYAGSLISILL